jgi:hypothetical protein
MSVEVELLIYIAMESECIFAQSVIHRGLINCLVPHGCSCYRFSIQSCQELFVSIHLQWSASSRLHRKCHDYPGLMRAIFLSDESTNCCQMLPIR